jgi:hypothetical protein
MPKSIVRGCKIVWVLQDDNAYIVCTTDVTIEIFAYTVWFRRKGKFWGKWWYWSSLKKTNVHMNMRQSLNGYKDRALNVQIQKHSEG